MELNDLAQYFDGLEAPKDEENPEKWKEAHHLHVFSTKLVFLLNLVKFVDQKDVTLCHKNLRKC